MQELEIVEYVNCPRLGVTPTVACSTCEHYGGRLKSENKILCKSEEK